MRTTVLLILIILCKQDAVRSVRVLELRVPAHAPEGGDALLGCQYDLEGDALYSVKWYKDDNEFYRFVPRARPQAYYFETLGVNVDKERSSRTVVSLTNLSQASTGMYKCEISGEAPRFTTVHDEKMIKVYYLPKNKPEITGVVDEYMVGDRVVVNCTSSASRPEAQLKWLLNYKSVPRHHVRGPWYRVSDDRPDTVESILQLNFIVNERHFVGDVMKLICHAAVAPLYQAEETLEITKFHPYHELDNELHLFLPSPSPAVVDDHTDVTTTDIATRLKIPLRELLSLFMLQVLGNFLRN